MLRSITILLFAGGLVACQEPALSGGDASGIGHLYFLRAVGGFGANSSVVLHVTTGSDYTAKRAFGGIQLVADRPAVSPDDAYMAWTDVTLGVYPLSDSHHLYVRRKSSGTTVDLIGDGGSTASYPSWSSDGRLFVRWRTGYDGEGGKWRLLSMAHDGSDRRWELESEPLIGTMPAISPEGRNIAWVLPGYGAARLEVVDRLSTARAPMNDLSRYVDLQDPSWAPDGLSVVVVVQVAAANPRRLRVLALDGRLLHELSLDGILRRPVFAPDGRSVAFCKLYQSSPGAYLGGRVMVWTLATGALRTIGGDGQGSDCYPTWSR